jgi:hypothetical protein
MRTGAKTVVVLAEHPTRFDRAALDKLATMSDDTGYGRPGKSRGRGIAPSGGLGVPSRAARRFLARV